STESYFIVTLRNIIYEECSIFFSTCTVISIKKNNIYKRKRIKAIGYNSFNTSLSFYNCRNKYQQKKNFLYRYKFIHYELINIKSICFLIQIKTGYMFCTKEVWFNKKLKVKRKEA